MDKEAVPGHSININQTLRYLILIGITMLLAVVAVVFLYQPSYKVTFGEDTLFIAEKGDLVAGIEELNQESHREYGLSVHLVSQPGIQPCFVRRGKCLSYSDLLGRLKENENMEYITYAIAADGKEIAAVGDRSEAEAAVSEAAKTKRAGVLEIREKLTRETAVNTYAEAVKLLAPQTSLGQSTRMRTAQSSSVLGRPVPGVITSRYGMRWGHMHQGIDIAGRVGSAIKAAASGKVIFTGRVSGYGKLVKIEHETGDVTYYGHCQKFLVSSGQTVEKGQKIATIGMTGITTGPHVHFEVRKNGVPINPLKYIK